MLHKDTAELGVQFASPSYEIAVMYESEIEDLVDVEVQQAVMGTYPNTEHTQFKIVPATLAAVLMCEGGYTQLQSINNELSRWILENGYELCGQVINIYHISPKMMQDSNHLLTLPLS